MNVTLKHSGTFQAPELAFLTDVHNTFYMDHPDRRNATTDQDSAQRHPAAHAALEELAPLRINREALIIDEDHEVGRGGFGVVMRAQLNDQSFTSHSTEVAVKRCFTVMSEGENAKIMIRLARELKIRAKLNHPNILRLIGFYFALNPPEALIVSPYMQKGSAENFMKRGDVGNEKGLKLVQDALEGLKYLHGLTPPITHGDVKAANLLINDEDNGVLCDYGLSIALDDGGDGLNTSGGLKGSIPWCSPDIFMGASRSPAGDIWAWACLILEILKRRRPYEYCWNGTDRRFNVGYLIKGICWDKWLPEHEQELSLSGDLGEMLLRRCWMYEPSQRPTAFDCSEIFDRLMGAELSSRLKSIPNHGVPPLEPSHDPSSQKSEFPPGYHHAYQQYNAASALDGTSGRDSIGSQGSGFLTVIAPASASPTGSAGTSSSSSKASPTPVMEGRSGDHLHLQMKALKQRYQIVTTERFETEGPKDYESWKFEAAVQRDSRSLVANQFTVSGLGFGKEEAQDHAVERFVQTITSMASKAGS
ncbi:hypothetical protein FRB96_007002 [Tulasnella sp. 330]|nr:hypothetical protein FRB96_007002 [Tulasnella sp. 330]